MSMTYATVTGRIVVPGTTTGIPGQLTATPLTAGGVLAFPAEDYTTIGPAYADVATDGTLTPSLKIPTDVPDGTLWRLKFVPKGKGNLPVHLGDFEISASTDLADLVPVNVMAITPTVAANIAAAAALGATNDSATASFIEDTGSDTHAALSATYARGISLREPRFGVVGNGVANDTAAVQAAIDAAATAGTWVYAPPGTYRVAGVVLKNDTTIIGAGSELTTFKLPDGGSGEVFISQGFSGLTGGGTSGGVSGVSLTGFTIHGNRANDAAGTWGLRKYGYRWRLRDIIIRECGGGGIYSEWGNGAGAGTDGDFMEDLISEVRVHECSGMGIQWRGPHDTRMEQVLIYANTGIGLSIEGSTTYHAGGIVLDAVHVYGNQSHGVQIISSNSNQGASVNAATLISESNTGTGLILAANGTIISSGNFYNNGGGGIDIQSFAAGYSIHTALQNNTGQQLKFTNDGGDGIISAGCYTATAGQATVAGTPHTSTMLLIIATGNGTKTNRLYAPGIDAQDTGVLLRASLLDGPTVDLTGRTSVDAREILKGQNGSDTYYQVTVDKQLNVQNAAGTTQPLKAGSVTADTGMTVGSGVAFLADSVTLRLPRTATTSAGYFWYDATTGMVVFRDGVSNADRQVAYRDSRSNTNLNSITDSVNTAGKFAGKRVWNTSVNRPVWATGSTAASTWVYADGTTAHTPA